MSTSPLFLTIERVLSLHAVQLERYGGQDGVRDAGLLESAIAMPRAAFGGERVHPELPDMAAAYLFYLCKNHPFLDGNKRTAAAAALVFLLVNGVRLMVSDELLTDLTLSIASGTADKAEAAEFFRRHWPAGSSRPE